MARGNYSGKKLTPEDNQGLQAAGMITRTTNQFRDVDIEGDVHDIPLRRSATRVLPSISQETTQTLTSTGRLARRTVVPRQTDEPLPLEEHQVKPLRKVNPPPEPPLPLLKSWHSPAIKKHHGWLKPWIISSFTAIICLLVLLSAAMLQRQDNPQIVKPFNGGVYNVQVGGPELASSWQTSDLLPMKTPIGQNSGEYSVLGKPTLTVEFMNRVLENYGSPARGKGQSLYDLGVKYGIDPAYAMAFFLMESTFGTRGIARETLSLGNLRCIPNAKCEKDQAWFNSWEEGFEAWYRLIRNLYVAQWGRDTVEKIIPKYAPSADNNDEGNYVRTVRRAVDTWHSGDIRV